MSLWRPPGSDDDWSQVEVEPHPTKAYVTEDGRRFQDSTVTVPIKWAAEMHAGYRCARCLEPLQELGAFPERCPVCQFEVARYQRQALEEQYQGTEVLPSGIPWDREREILEAELQRPKGKATMAVPKKRRSG